MSDYRILHSIIGSILSSREDVNRSVSRVQVQTEYGLFNVSVRTGLCYGINRMCCYDLIPKSVETLLRVINNNLFANGGYPVEGYNLSGERVPNHKAYVRNRHHWDDSPYGRARWEYLEKLHQHLKSVIESEDVTWKQ